MKIRGVRGATVTTKDNEEEILSATIELLEAILNANPTMNVNDLASVFYTLTEDLHSTYPARAAREMGWNLVPFLCAREISVPGGLPRCIRILMHWNTDLAQDEIQHVYLRDAIALRPDLMKKDVPS